MANIESPNHSVDQAIAEGGAYEVIRRRLTQQGADLKQAVGGLNAERLEEFGSSEMAVTARIRVRTANNCVPRDIVQVGEHLLFGFNVFIGLRTETAVGDVFALFKTVSTQDGLDVQEVSLADSFLAASSFVRDFHELYRYYKHTKLVQLQVRDGKLLAAFQIGERREDIRVFRWALPVNGGTITYIDNRGERDISPPPAYDFEWQAVSREQVVNGKYPHINILDKVFVETVAGDLTIKVENNTETGLGIYAEAVEAANQSIDDGEFLFAELGALILLKIRPYQEKTWRYLVFNSLTQSVVRIDAIGGSCVQLPEDHGIVFPGGYYLQSGEYKTFDEQGRSMHFRRMIRSPNGEDVLYVFYEQISGLVGLFAYNMINKTLQNPLYGDGYALADDGTLVIFAAVAEPTRVHPMQVWQTPFYSDEFAAVEPPRQTELGRIGNAELVRGISDVFAVVRATETQSVSVRLYEDLQQAALKVFDDHYWVGGRRLEQVANLLREIASTAELAVDEFEKVKAIRAQSVKALVATQERFNELQTKLRSARWDTAQDYVHALDSIRTQRGAVASCRELRYIETGELDKLDQNLLALQQSVSEQTVQFLAEEKSLAPFAAIIAEQQNDIEAAKTANELAPVITQVNKNTAGLDLLSELLANIKIDDATVRTRIVDGISEVYAQFNQLKAKVNHKRKSLGSAEATAQFAAQLKLLAQSITNALALATAPERCDEQMSRLLVQLEELESQFAEHGEFLNDIITKREEIYESFESQKQRLLDERQRKAQNIADAAERLLASVQKRSQQFTQADELNTYFASDALLGKLKEFVTQLNELGSGVKADDIEARLKAIRDQAIRSQRDQADLYEGDGKVIKLGPKHKFSVNKQELDLTLLPRGDELYLHLSGTDFYEPVASAELQTMQALWQVAIESESAEVYRAEYLAANIYRAAQHETDSLSFSKLSQALLDARELQNLVRDFAAPRYKEGYEKGIHDQDAARILQSLVPALAAADLLVFDPLSRAFAQVFWANINHIVSQLKRMRLSFETWQERAQSACHMQSVFASQRAADLLAQEIRTAMREFIELHPFDIDDLHLHRAADYLVQELGREFPAFVVSKYGQHLADELRRSMDDNAWRRYQRSLERMLGWPSERWQLSTAWLQALVDEKSLQHLKRYIPEAAALINCDQRVDRRLTEVDLELSVSGLLGEHPLLERGTLKVSLDAFMEKIEHHRSVFVKEFHDYQKLRHQVLEHERKRLRLREFKPKPLTSFVRNRLINEAYLPIIGDNLAKQMGALGDAKRTDLMGLLMMISPPGYGKTTLMEYVAAKLGLIFMKINCPALGHEVTSLDPKTAPNSTARQELYKLNLALEMGSNVMLYLDDIQHTHPEFLQKFISLCDGTRRIEGVWRNESRTYDMRGKKFCVVMAGNPYTESGETFKVPDMLANRADIYNLGDILGGMNEPFELSYIENSLTSNPVLAPLATRAIEDVYRFVKMAQGESIPTTDLAYQYSAAEVAEITSVLQKLFRVRDVLLKVNQQYIRSAAQADAYRTEPPFKLQGSYRNMNKLAEKVSAVMNEAELDQLIADHYLGEAQLLTTGAEENLLKLQELRGCLAGEDAKRWQAIKANFLKTQALGGDDAEAGDKIAVQLYDMRNTLAGLAHTYQAQQQVEAGQLRPAEQLEQAMKALADKLKPQVNVVNQPVPGLDVLLKTLTDAIENSLFPIVRSMDKKLEIDLRTHYKMKEVSKQLLDIELLVQNDLRKEREEFYRQTPAPGEVKSTRKSVSRKNNDDDQ